jgi:hypothetical protein
LTYYSILSEAWLAIMDSKKAEVLPVLEKAYGAGNALKWYVQTQS